MTATHATGSNGQMAEPFNWPLTNISAYDGADAPTNDAFVFSSIHPGGDSGCCLDSGASHHIATRQFYDRHQDWFTDVGPADAAHLPTSVQGLFGREPVWRVAAFHPPWPQWAGLTVPLMLIVANGHVMLISERQLVTDNKCTVTHSPVGKWVTLHNGDTVDMVLRSGVHWMPSATDAGARAVMMRDPPDLVVTATQPDDGAPTTPASPTDIDTSWLPSYHNLYTSWFASKCPTASPTMVSNLANAKCDGAIQAVGAAATRGLSKTYRWAASVLGYRSPRQVSQFARLQNMSLTERDATYVEAALQGRGRVKPDPAQTRTQRPPRMLWAQDPVTYKAAMFGGVRVIFFTIDAGTSRVRSFACKSKTTANAVAATKDYARYSGVWANDVHAGPQLFQTDDDTIYKSAEWFDFLRTEAIQERRSAPYAHRQNSLIEKSIGIVHGSALSMTHAVNWVGSPRMPAEFLHYAVAHQCFIDSMLAPRGNDDEDCPFVREQHAKGTTATADFSRIQHPWGSRVFVVLAKTSQLSARGRYGYFVGVSEAHRSAMFVYVPSTDKVITSQNVYFNATSKFNYIPNQSDNDLWEVTLDELPTSTIPLVRTTTAEFPTDDIDDEQHLTTVETAPPRITVGVVSSSMHEGVQAPLSEDASEVDGTNVTGTSDDTPVTMSEITIGNGTTNETPAWAGPMNPTEALDAGWPVDTTVNQAGELVIGLGHHVAGAAVYDDTCGLCPDYNEEQFAARGYNACSTLADWGTDDWIYSDLTIDEGHVLDDTQHRCNGHWEDCLPSFDPSTALSYLIHEPRELVVRHNDASISDIFVARFPDDEEPGVATDATAYATAPPDTPQSLTEALASPDPDDRAGYRRAADKEMDGHLNNGTWIPWDGPLPAGKRALRTKLFFTKKIGADGKLASHKARLVVGGHRQRPEDFDQISSPIPTEASINVFMTLLASEDLDAIHVDWSQAFVSAPSDRDIWVYLPKEYGSTLVLLKRQLYGLRQASFQFNKYVVEKLAAQGVTPLPSERCLFVKYVYPRRITTEGDGVSPGNESSSEPWYGTVADEDLDAEGRLLSNNVDVHGNRIPHKILALLWVDDFVVGSTYRNGDVPELIKALKRDFRITVDDFEWFLKCEVVRDRASRKLYVAQTMFAAACVMAIMGVSVELVKKTHGTPLPESYMPSELGKCKSKEDVDFMASRKDRYRSHVAKLLWLCRTRQELRFAVTALCKFMSDPGPSHWADLKRIARYIAGNIRKGLLFEGKPEPVQAWTDADWGADPSTRRSVGGYWATFLGCTAHSSCKRQRLVAMSSFESELIAALEAARTLVWLRRLVGELGYFYSEPSTLWIDNQAVLTVEASTMQSWRCRAIPLRYFAIRQYCDDLTITFKYVKTGDNVADIFTKQIGRVLWDRHECKLVCVLPW
jgi:hypothetical protein